MRLWHTRIISVLPRLQLLAQWRECCSIYAKKDNHILINFIYAYEDDHFYSYSRLIIEEMEKRGYYISKNAMNRFSTYFKNETYKRINSKDVFNHKMDDRYLRQCYYNLQEKFDCGAIRVEEWTKIQKYFEQHYPYINSEPSK